MATWSRLMTPKFPSGADVSSVDAEMIH